MADDRRFPVRRLAPGERLVVGYKAVKSVVEIALAVALGAVIAAHDVPRLQDATAAFVGRAAWLSHVTDPAAVTRMVTPTAVELTAALCLLDGLSSAFEGWALHTGRPWGAWIVVVATSAFLPLEIAALARHPRLGPLLAFVVNVAIVVYLSRRARRRAAALRPPSDLVHWRVPGEL